MSEQNTAYYDRESLYSEVWKEPMTVVSKRYGVSDVALAKTCKKLNVPRPPVGYWAKKEFGKAPPRPPLPAFRDPPKIFRSPIVIIKPKQNSESYLVPEAFEEAQKLIEQETRPDMLIVAKGGYSHLDPFVENTKKKLVSSKAHFYGNDYGRLSISGPGLFTLKIGPESKERVIIILQSLAMAFEKRGFTLLAEEKREPGISVMIMGEKVYFSIFEPCKKVASSAEEIKKTYQKYQYVPTGKLKLEIASPPYKMIGTKAWSDGHSKKLEAQLNMVVIRLIATAAWIKETKEYWAREEEKRKIEQKLQLEKQKLKEIDERRISNLEKKFQAWIYHKKLTEYLAAVENNYAADKEAHNEDFMIWLEWAHRYLEKIAPFKDQPPKYDLPNPYS